MANIVIHCGDIAIPGILQEGATSDALARALPLDTTAQRWGDELYCATPVVTTHEQSTRDVAVGDIAYWVEGQSLCLFFGRTPVSTDENPRPIVPVNVIGKFTLDERIRSVHDGTPVRIHLEAS
jgi:uncharacterized protein